MAKKAEVYASFTDPNKYIVFGSGEVSDDAFRLIGVEPVHIRTNDLNMPVAAYGGHNVGAPPNGNSDYYFNLPAGQGDLYTAMMETVETVGENLSSNHQMYIYPRNNASSFYMAKLVSTTYDYIYISLGNYRIYPSNHRHPAGADRWARWEWQVLNKYFFDLKRSEKGNDISPDYGGHYHICYDPGVAANPPLSRLRTNNWTSGEIYLRAPSRAYEDTDNPAIIDLYPLKAAHVLPKNSANKYWTVTQEWHDAFAAGAAEFILQTAVQVQSRHLFTGTLTGVKNDFGFLREFQINEGEFGLGDGIILGGHIMFPDRSDAGRPRICAFNAAAQDQMWAYKKKLPDGVVVSGQRVDAYINSEFPIFATYPINESNPVFYAWPIEEDITKVIDPSDIPVGTKLVFGLALNNYINPQEAPSCSEISFIESPTHSYIFPIDLEVGISHDLDVDVQDYYTIISTEVPEMRTVYRSDTVTFNFVIKDQAGGAINLINYDVYLAAKLNIDDSEYVFNRQCDIDDAQGGLCSVQLSAADTGQAGTFHVELVLIGKAGTAAEGKEHTATQFQLCIRKDLRT